MRDDSRMDEFLFGKRRKTKQVEEEPKKEDAKKDFNLMETAGTIMQTYEQLSPYVKHLRNHAKKFMSKKK
ncbi:hypothetical protein SFC66_13495 [Terribacillus saccharophilus]|uniref:hypothetical protein n=1 Tax=Terribacillus saccharophilus TaxID=361277 RepID=UPI003981D54F